MTALRLLQVMQMVEGQRIAAAQCAINLASGSEDEGDGGSEAEESEVEMVEASTSKTRTERSEGEGEGNAEEDDGSAEEPRPPAWTTYPPGGPSLRTAHGDLRHHPGA